MSNSFFVGGDENTFHLNLFFSLFMMQSSFLRLFSFCHNPNSSLPDIGFDMKMTDIEIEFELTLLTYKVFRANMVMVGIFFLWFGRDFFVFQVIPKEILHLKVSLMISCMIINQ